VPVSVPVGDVPSAEGSLRAGIIPLAEPLAAQFTLTLLLLQYLEGDGSKFGSAGEDAVGIELDFFHVLKVGWIERKVNGEILRESGDLHISNGSYAINPLPLANLLSGRNGTIHIVLALHCHSVLLPFVVGSDVIHLNGSAGERGPGAAHVEGRIRKVCFVHTSMMAQIPGFGSSPRYRTEE